ncbi:DUF305 domain-containing protein [Streptomyces sp. 6N223]|uniref:DUF305 domain-containing protein n=1 Tax=Streptomyces sp. 6N223 TaxID=3457412 RepID=UPI003FD2A190
MTGARLARGWWAAAAALGLVALALLGTRALADGDDDGGDGGEPAVPAADSADVGFSRDMAVHHQQAVEMSFIVRDRTDDREVRNLAYDIINTQANQRGMLLGLLTSWEMPLSSSEPPMTWMDHDMADMGFEPHDGALMPGMATDAQIEELREAEGREAEVLYLRLMTEHHRAGVDMAEGAVASAEDSVVVRLAEGMVEGQESEIQLMADLLDERGAGASGGGPSQENEHRH